MVFTATWTDENRVHIIGSVFIKAPSYRYQAPSYSYQAPSYRTNIPATHTRPPSYR